MTLLARPFSEAGGGERLGRAYPKAGEKEHLHLAHSKCTIWRVGWVSSLVWIMAKRKFVYLRVVAMKKGTRAQKMR